MEAKKPHKGELISVRPEVRPGLGGDGTAQSLRLSSSSSLGESQRQALHSAGPREGKWKAAIPRIREAAVRGIARARGGARGE